MREGKDIALITDAGTPALSDPGEDLVRICYEEGIEVISLPGACACVTALTVSGLSTRRFAFEAFLPRDKKKRGIILEELKTETRTMILYEAPHHLVRTLQDVYQALGNRKISVCRELTKKHEEVMRSTIADTIAFYQNQDPRGEYVLVIEGKSYQDIEKENREDWMHMDLEEHMKLYESKGVARKEAMKMVAKDRGISKREVYQQLLDL